MKRRRALLISLLLAVPAVLDAENCSVCGKKLHGRYLRSGDGQYFCSRKCADSKLPRCALCGKAMRGRYLQTEKGDFCSEECMHQALWPHCGVCGKAFQNGRRLPTPYGELVFCPECAKLPTCFICQSPVKAGRTLPDGRLYCARCGENVVTDQPSAQEVFRSVRAVLRNKLNFPNDHNIALVLTAVPPPQNSPQGATQEFGRYIYTGREIYSTPSRLLFWKKQETTVRREEKSCRIEVLDKLPRKKLAEVLAHELAHDYMQRRWPYIKDEKLKEGFAELIAAQYNRFTDHAAWNVRMENNPDPVYGDGYRMMRDLWNKGGWSAVEQHLERANRANLPPELRR